MTCGNTDARSTPAAAGTSPSRASQRGQRTGKRNMGDARAADGRTARALLLADLAHVRPVAELGTRERRRVERDGAARRREVELGTRGRGRRLGFSFTVVVIAMVVLEQQVAMRFCSIRFVVLVPFLAFVTACGTALQAAVDRERELRLGLWPRSGRLRLGLRLALVVVLEQLAAALVLAHRLVERVRSEVVPHASALQPALAGERELRLGRGRGELRGVRDHGGGDERAEREGGHGSRSLVMA